MLDHDDNELVVFLAGCSLDSSPGKNWVEKSGGLPNYICRIARAVMRSGKPKGMAIAIAISRTKKWAAGVGDVDADTRAKAAKAVAQWEALKAKNKAKKVVKASREDGSEFLLLSNIGAFNTSVVREAWDSIQREVRQRSRSEAKAAGMDMDYVDTPYSYVKELWTDHIIVEVEPSPGSSEGIHHASIPYTVDGGDVSFGMPVPVEQQWTEIEDDEELSEIEKLLLGDLLSLSTQRSNLDLVTELSRKR